MRGMLLKTLLSCGPATQRGAHGENPQKSVVGTQDSGTPKWLAWFSGKGISMGPVWKSGTQLLAWDGCLGEGCASGGQRDLEEEKKHVKIILQGLGGKGWRFLEGAWGPFRLGVG